MTAALLQLCTFTLDELWFGIPVDGVQEVVRDLKLTPVPLAVSAVRGLLNLRGQIVTAIDLRRRLEMPERDDERPPIHVVVRTDDGLISLLADRIGDVVTVSSDTRDNPPPTLQGAARELIRGAYQMPNRLLLELDLNLTLTLDPTTTSTLSHSQER